MLGEQLRAAERLARDRPDPAETDTASGLRVGLESLRWFDLPRQCLPAEIPGGSAVMD
jgi:hypothetical protein